MPVVVDQFEMMPESVAAPADPGAARRMEEPGPRERADEVRVLLAREAERSLRGRSS